MPLFNNNILFFHIPKCGGTGLELQFERLGKFNRNEWFGPRILDDKTFLNIQHATPEQVLQLNLTTQEQFDFYHKCIIVRNPWSKLVSAYTWFFHAHTKDFPTFLKDIYEMLEKQNGYNTGIIVSEKWKTVDDNIQNRRSLSNLFLPQVRFLYVNDKNVMDYIGKIEDMEHTINHLNTLGVNLELIVANPSPKEHKHQHYTKYYNTETKNLIKEMYQEDIDTFGYTFE